MTTVQNLPSWENATALINFLQKRLNTTDPKPMLAVLDLAAVRLEAKARDLAAKA